MNGRVLLVLTGVALILLWGFLAWSNLSRRTSLPYQDSFAQHDAAEWIPYGGQWQVRDGLVVNRSDEDGAKLVTGSAAWTDYEMDAEIKLVGQDGNAGVIVRVNDEEQGADAYKGYYVGLRTADSAFVVGRADHGWLGGHPVTVLGGVRTGEWYHLRVVIVGCTLGAEVTNLTSRQRSDLAFEDHPCVKSGRIGLRSMTIGGAWRHIRVSAADQSQLRPLLAKAPFITGPMYPIREADYNRMMEQLARSAPKTQHDSGPGHTVTTDKQPSMVITAEKATATSDDLVTLRGVVTLTSPLYIQDETGGLEIRGPDDSDINLGDEVQVTGHVVPTSVAPYLKTTEMIVVSERAPVSPIAVTGAQAADGSFDGRLVQLSGVLLSKSNHGDAVQLRMNDGEVGFNAVVRGPLTPAHLQNIELGSTLRLQGICRIGPGLQDQNSAFTILLRSMDDVELQRGPPWWTPRIVIWYALALVGLLGLGIYLYLSAERNKMQAILEERERVALEMHDTLAQSFAGVSFQLQGVCNSLRAGVLPLSAVTEKLEVACKMVTHTHRAASAEIAALHPATSEEALDLLQVLERATHTMAEDHLPSLRLIREGAARRCSMSVRDALFQVGRESIANILRHSAASEVVLRLRYEPRRVLLEIRDNGCGFCYQDHALDFGIRGMRRRMERLDGTLRICTAPGQGTTVTATSGYGLRFGAARLRLRGRR